MFYSQFILAKKGPLGTLWIAAHLERKLRKNQVAETNIGVSVDSILFPDVPIALRLSGHLLLGVVRIYSKKVNYLFHDCSEALNQIKQAFHTTVVDLPPEAATAPFHSITLPETFDFDELELLQDSESSFFQSNGNYVDHHISTREQITLQDPIEHNPYLGSSQFGLDERFGDGDCSQMDLEFDEEFLDQKSASAAASTSMPLPKEDDQAIQMDIDDYCEPSTSQSGLQIMDAGNPGVTPVFELDRIEVDEQRTISTLGSLLDPLDQTVGGKATTKGPGFPSVETLAPMGAKATFATPTFEARTPDLNQEFCPPDEPSTPALPEEASVVAHKVFLNSVEKETGMSFPASPVNVTDTVQDFMPASQGSMPPPSGGITHDLQVAGSADKPSFTSATEGINLTSFQGFQLHSSCMPGNADFISPPLGQLKKEAPFTQNSFPELEQQFSSVRNQPTAEVDAEAVKGPDSNQLTAASFHGMTALQGLPVMTSTINTEGMGANHVQYASPVDTTRDPGSAFFQGFPQPPVIQQNLMDNNLSATSNPLQNQLYGTSLATSSNILSQPCMLNHDIAFAFQQPAVLFNQGATLPMFSDDRLMSVQCAQPSSVGTVESSPLQRGIAQDQLYNSTEMDRPVPLTSHTRLHENDLQGKGKTVLHASGIPHPETLRSAANAEREGNDFLYLRNHMPLGNLPALEFDGDSTRVQKKEEKLKEVVQPKLMKTPALRDDTPFRTTPFSTRSLDSLPGDDDVLASILGRRTATFQVIPTPKERPVRKRPRAAPKSVAKKRKSNFDSLTVLHGDVIKEQLANTHDIQRERKKAPCTRREVWSFDRDIQVQQNFYEPSTPGLSTDLHELYQLVLGVYESKLPFADVVVETTQLGEGADVRINGQEKSKDSIEGSSQALLTPDSSRTSAEILQTSANVLSEGPTDHLKKDDTTVSIPSAACLHEESSAHQLLSQPRAVAPGEAGAETGKEQECLPTSAIESNTLTQHVQEEVTCEQEQLPVLEVNPSLLTRRVSDDTARTDFQISEQPNLCESMLEERQATQLNREQVIFASSIEQTSITQTPCKESVNLMDGQESNKISELEADIDREAKVLELQEGPSCVESQVNVNYLQEDGQRYHVANLENKEHTVTSSDVDNANKNIDLKSFEVPGENILVDEENPNKADGNLKEDMKLDDEKHVSDTLCIDRENAPDNDQDGGCSSVQKETDPELPEEDDDMACDEMDGFGDSSSDEQEADTQDDSGWSTRTINIGRYLKTVFEGMESNAQGLNEKGDAKLGLERLLHRRSRREAARMFFETLVLKTKDYIHVEQQGAFEDVHLFPKSKLMKMTF